MKNKNKATNAKLISEELSEIKDNDPMKRTVYHTVNATNNEYNRIEADYLIIDEDENILKFYTDNKLSAIYPKQTTIIKRIVYVDNLQKETWIDTLRRLRKI